MSGDSSVLGRQHLTACSILLRWGLCPKLKHCPDTEVATACSSQRGVQNELCCARRSASNAGNPISPHERTSASACFSPRDCKLPDRWAKKLSEPVAGRRASSNSVLGLGARGGQGHAPEEGANGALSCRQSEAATRRSKGPGPPQWHLGR